MDFHELIAASDPAVFTQSLSAWVSGISVNSVIMLVMMIFMLVGAVDKIRGNKLGYGEKFEEGFNTMGGLAMSMAGVYAAAPILSMLLGPVLKPVYGLVGASPAMFATTLLATDASLSGLVVTMPEEMTAEVLEEGISSRRTDVDGLYSNKRFVVGVPAISEDTPDPVGMVYAVSSTTSLDTMWSGFIGLFFMTAFVVLMISFMASSITTMRQIQPIREMAKATRRYAEGDFDIRMNDYGRDDELGELAASFNNMAENLQQTERQRREFITNISHELKTPMTTIAGYTDGILDGTIPPENERQYLQIISDESRRLSRLVRRMLDVSQLQAIDPLREGKHFDICESMRRVLISMERKITDRNLDVEADIPEEPILVLGDKDMITQVIYNLLENATKFAREGSTLYLGVTTIDGKARVTVRNEGDTIPAEELPLLFERFHKSDKSRSEDKDGYGLGLYIVKTILEQHKEKISVTSEDGVTAFSFSLATE